MGMMKEPDMTFQRAETLAAFGRSPDTALTCRDIRTATGLPQSTTYLALSKFVAAGWLSIEWKQLDPASNESPCRCWRLTETGRALIARDQDSAEQTASGTSEPC